MRVLLKFWQPTQDQREGEGQEADRPGESDQYRIGTQDTAAMMTQITQISFQISHQEDLLALI